MWQTLVTANPRVLARACTIQSDYARGLAEEKSASWAARTRRLEGNWPRALRRAQYKELHQKVKLRQRDDASRSPDKKKETTPDWTQIQKGGTFAT